jgi:hypothetical protein
MLCLLEKGIKRRRQPFDLGVLVSPSRARVHILVLIVLATETSIIWRVLYSPAHKQFIPVFQFIRRLWCTSFEERSEKECLK